MPCTEIEFDPRMGSTHPDVDPDRVFDASCERGPVCCSTRPAPVGMQLPDDDGHGGYWHGCYLTPTGQVVREDCAIELDETRV